MLKLIVILMAASIAGCASLNQLNADLDPTNPNSAISRQMHDQAVQRQKNCEIDQASRDFCNAQDTVNQQIIAIRAQQ